MFIDTHAHLNDDRLINNVEQIIERAKAQKVNKIVCVGSNLKESKTAVKLAQQFDNVYATVGVHPHHCLEFNVEMENLILSAKNNKKIVAIGEIGLDYYDLDYQISKYGKKDITEKEFINKQKEVFLKQIELADKINLPVMIHMREATADTLSILEENKDKLKAGGIMHCYNGSLETTKRVFDLGLYISIGGAITFKNAKVMPEVLKKIGLSKVLLETDCPYLSPEPYRGKINEPANIPIIATKISELTNTTVDEVAKKTTENCYKVLGRLND